MIVPHLRVRQRCTCRNIKLESLISLQSSDYRYRFLQIESAKIYIYNLKGQTVKELYPILNHPEFNEGQDNNHYSVTWNGENEAEKPVSSGVYFYKLQVNDNTEAVNKCLMLK